MEGVDPTWMRPGMSARVLVARRICQDCLLAPRRALRPDGEGGARALLRSGKWVSVKLGPCSDFRCAVDEGLEEGVLLAPADDPEVPA